MAGEADGAVGVEVGDATGTVMIEGSADVVSLATAVLTEVAALPTVQRASAATVDFMVAVVPSTVGTVSAVVVAVASTAAVAAEVASTAAVAEVVSTEVVVAASTAAVVEVVSTVVVGMAAVADTGNRGLTRNFIVG